MRFPELDPIFVPLYVTALWRVRQKVSRLVKYAKYWLNPSAPLAFEVKPLWHVHRIISISLSLHSPTQAFV